MNLLRPNPDAILTLGLLLDARLTFLNKNINYISSIVSCPLGPSSVRHLMSDPYFLAAYAARDSWENQVAGLRFIPVRQDSFISPSVVRLIIQQDWHTPIYVEHLA